MKSLLKLFSSAFLFCLTLSLPPYTHATERILVVGDSITGHSMNLPYGYANQIRKLLKEESKDIDFIPLGGSGQTIFSWRHIISNSYENNQRLDIPGIMVKDEFDRGADVILVHLGMNDALQPSVPYTEEGLKSWKQEYVSLVQDLKKRVPNVSKIILTPPTMLTENPYDFKNFLMDQFSDIIQEVAAEEKCEFYNLRNDFKEAFINARLQNPDFHITLDFVHPNEPGHQAMSCSFLQALGLSDLAQKFYNTQTASCLKESQEPSATFFVCDVPLKNQFAAFGKTSEIVVPIEIRGVLNHLSLDDLQISSESTKLLKSTASSNDEVLISMEAQLNQLPATVTIKAGEKTQTILVNAPYFVTTGFAFESYPNPEGFPKEKAITEIDQATLKGENPLTGNFSYPSSNLPVQWYCSFPTFDKTGDQNPNALDIAALQPANAFDAAYAVRFITSPSNQKATLKLNSEGFSTTAIEKIYLNGKEIYFDCLSPRHIKAQDQIEVDLKEGLNVLVSRIDHTYWQWAVSFSFENAEGLTF